MSGLPSPGSAKYAAKDRRANQSAAEMRRFGAKGFHVSHSATRAQSGQ
jgi:hypothetical protein